VPSPVSALWRGIARVLDPTRVEARGDLEYYTLDEVEAGAASGDRTFLLPDGEINYNMVGLSKGDEATSVSRLFSALNAYQTQDSMFRDERDENAIMYDTLGNAIGAEDISIANRPGLAIWNSISGIRIVPGQELTPVEDELMRLAAQTNNWPLTNRESMNGLRLSPGAQSDLTNLAKNEVTLGREEVMDRVTINFGGADFRGALDRAINSTIYARMSDKEKAGYLRRIEDLYYESAFESLLEEPQYANLRQAYEGIQERQRLENRGRR